MSLSQLEVGMSSDHALTLLTDLEKSTTKSRRIGSDENGLLVAWRFNDGTEVHLRREKRPEGERYYIYEIVNIG